MPKFVQLVKADGAPVIVNAELVRYLTDRGDGQTAVVFDDKDTLRVKGSPHEIADQIVGGKW